MGLWEQVYKLMLPHFRYTMHINTNARSILINADGTLENIFTSGRCPFQSPDNLIQIKSDK